MKIKFDINGSGKEWILNGNQAKFFLDKAKYVAYVGGRGGGKSLCLVLKLIDLMLRYPKNYGLLARYNYSDLKDSTMKDFFDVCPPEYIKSYNKQEKTVTFYNGSALIFRGLKEVKKTEVRSLNLGFFALEQAEEMDEELFDELTACLRKKLTDYDGKDGKQQGFLIANPSLDWIFKRFKQEKNPEYSLVPCSMLDNAQNLGDSFLQDQLSKPDSWKRVFVYGLFDENILSGKRVIPTEYIIEQEKFIRTPIKKLDDIDIYRDPEPGHQYQMGIDPSEGAEDYSIIKCVDISNGEEVASYASRIQPDLLALKVDKMGEHYNGAKAVLEINGIGLATLTKMKELNYENIFMREEYDKISKSMTQKLGWRTTHASKPLLTGHFQELLNKNSVKIHDEQTISEMKTFVYSDDARSKGMGATRGFHDDRIMAIMLAYWDLRPVGEQIDTKDLVIKPQEEKEGQEEILHIEQFIDNPESKQHWLQN